MKVRVDRDKCYMSGECYYNHPELFAMDDDGYPRVLVEELNTATLQQHAQDAMEVCPAGALTLD
ncbi:MAG: ferredoxin [Pseudomonadota bacterium]